MIVRILLAAVVCLTWSAAAASGRPADRQFMAGYTGSLPSAPHDLAKTYFRRAEVRRLLSTLEAGPLSEMAARQLLAGTSTSLADLERMTLIKDRGGKVSIGFAYFTAADMTLIHRVAAAYVPSLVAAYRSRSAALQADLARYPIASVNAKRLAFVLLAGFSLNWDGLDLLREKAYRIPLLVKGPGWQYSFWAEEETPGYSYKGYYWGSSSFPAGTNNVSPPVDFTLSSFGDPDSDPRQNFPDLLTLPTDQMTADVRVAAQALGLRSETALGTSFHDVIGISRTRELGDLLFAMRAGATSEPELCAQLTSDNDKCDAVLNLLAAAGYVRRGASGYHLLVPVFDWDDRILLDDVLGLSRNILQQWLRQNYSQMQEALSGLTAVKAAVPYTALFSQVWHEIFGLATRDLAEQRVIEDANSTPSPWKGSVPAVWRMSLFKHVWE